MTLLSTSAQSKEILEEVLVTAQKREEKLKDVGIAITALQGDQMRALGFTKTLDVADYTPGLVVGEQGGPDITSVGIRGVGGALAGFAEPPVGLVIDQTYYPSQSFQNWSTFDVERVEVLRGPQGVLFGRNTTGGVIQVISRKPTKSFEGYGDLSAGSVGDAQDFKFEGAMSGPLTENTQGRLSVNGISRGDYYTNRVGRDLGGGDSYGVRAQLLFEPRDNVEIHVLGSYNSTHYRTTYTHVAAGFNSDGLEYALSPSEDFYGTCPGCDASGYGNHGDLQTVDINADQTFTDLEISSFTGIMTWDVDWARFTSVTAYSEGKAKHFEDSDASPLDGANLSNPRKEDWLTQEFRLANEESGLRWQLGVFLMDWDARVNNFEFFLNLPYLGVQGQGTWQVHHTSQDRETKSWEVFGQIEKDLGSIPGLAFLLGLRWTDNVLTNDFRGYVEVDGVRVPGSEVDFREETVGDDAKINDDFLTGKAGINYKVNDDLLLYVSYSLGKKSGLFVNGIVAAPPEKINRETVDAYEVGMKGTFLKNRMQLNMAAFYYDYSDFQAFVFENLSESLRNVQSTVSGAEAEMVVTPAEGWFASLSVGYLDGVLKDVGLPTGRVIDMESPMAPTWKWAALLRKEWSAFGGTLALQGDITHSDSFFGDAVNTPVSAFDTERTLLGARVDWVTGDGKRELAINARNLTDEEYYQIVFPAGIGLGEGVPGLPRQLNAQIRHRF